MKKFLILCLAFVLVLSLAACGGGKTPGTQEDPKQDTAANLEDVDDALEILDALIPEGWDENKYGAYIYDVWDQDFLPDCFPAPPEGIKPEQTIFKDYTHDTLNGSYGLGNLYYESYEDYREYGVSFYANQEHLDAFVAAVEAKGMTGGQTEEGEWCIYEYFGSGWFMEIYASLMYNDMEYTYRVTVSATDSLFALPASISGIPLPQCGFVAYDHDLYTIQDFSDGYNDVDFDLAADTLPEEYYAAWFNYYCTVNQDALDYARQLKDLGWEVQWETDGEDGYRCGLYKDGVYAIANYYDYDCMLEVGFSDMVENLSY